MFAFWKQGEMITEFIEGGLNTKTQFFSNLVDVVNKNSEGTAWVWLSKKETHVTYPLTTPNRTGADSLPTTGAMGDHQEAGLGCVKCFREDVS